MLAHCAIAMEAAMGGQPRKQILLGKLIGPFVRSSALGEKPFSKNSPTDPTFVMSDSREFIAERNRLLHLIQRFAEQGPSSVSGAVHTFFGKLTGEEWGVLIYKHLDHHLRQFEA